MRVGGTPLNKLQVTLISVAVTLAGIFALRLISSQPARAAIAADTGSVTHSYASAHPGPLISDRSCKSGAYVTQTLYVPDQFLLGAVRVGINLTHTWRGDLFVRLTSPDGTSINVLNVGDGNANYNVLLDDASSNAPGPRPGAGSHSPTAPEWQYAWRSAAGLGVFKGAQTNGFWALSLCDAYWGDTGQMNDWSLYLDEDRSDYAGTVINAAPAGVAFTGDTLNYSIVIPNNTGRYGNVSVTAPFPAGSSYVAGSAQSSSSNGAFALASSQLAWAGSLASNDAVTVSYRLAVTALNGWLTNTVTVSDPLSLAPVVRKSVVPIAAPRYDQSRITVVPAAGALVKAGQVLSYSVILLNSGQVAGSANLANPVPNGVSYIAGSARATSGNLPTFDGASLAWSGNVNAGARVTITYQGAVKPLADVAQWNNVITNSATINDPLALWPATMNVTNPVAAPVYNLSSVKADVADNGGAILPGQPYTYIVSLVNNGALAGQAKLNAPLAASASYVAGSANASSGSTPVADSSGLYWSGSIGAGQKVTLTYQWVVNAINGLFSHTVSISDTQLGVPAVKLAVNPIAAPQYRDSTLTPNRLAVAVGERFTYTLVIRNSGRVSGADSSARVQLPAGLNPAGMPVASSGITQLGALNDAGTQVVWTGSVPSGGSVSIDIPVIASSLCGSEINVNAVVTDAVLPVGLAIKAPLAQTYSRLILNEDFNGITFPPSGWSLYRNSGNCDFTPANWYNHTGGQNGYAYANANGCGASTTMDTELRSPLFSLADVEAPILQFRSEYYQYTSKSQYGAVEISTNGSAGPWTTLWKRQTDDRGPKLYQIDLKPYAGLTNLMLRFHFYNQSRTWWWQVDDVLLYQVCPVSMGTDQQASACRGKTINYTLNVANNTAAADTVNLSYAMPGNGMWTGWPVSIQPASMLLNPYASATVNVAIAVPWVDTNGSQSGDVVVNALGANSGQSAQSTLRTTVGACGGWVSLAPAPLAAADAGAAYFNGSLYQIGGRADRSYLPMNGVYRYDITANNWQPMTSIPVAVEGIDALALGDQIYVVGGETNAQANTQTTLVQVYDPAFDRWTTVAPLPQPLAFYEALALNGRLYVIGGFSSGAVTNTLFIYDPTTNVWTRGASLAHARMFAASGVIGGKLYVAGGYDGARSLDSLEVYSLNPDGSGSWAGGPSMPRAIDSSASGVLAGRYLVAAGGWSGPPVTNRALAFDAQNGVWIDLPPMLSRRMGARADGDGSRLFAIGGYDIAGGDSTTSARNESISVCPGCSAADAPQGTLALTASATQVQAGTPVTFNAAIADTTLLNFDWDFGDGTRASGTNRSVSHSYVAAGSYVVIVTASNACGAVQSAITLNASQYGVLLNPETANRTVSVATSSPAIRMAVAATSITYTLRITNSGFVADQFAFSVSNSAGWSVALSAGPIVSLAPGQGADVVATVNMPLQQQTGVNTTTITATSETSNVAIAHSTLKTWIQPFVYYFPVLQR